MTSLSNTTTFTNETFKEYYGVVQYKETTPLRVFRLSCFTVIIIAGLIGNYLVCKVTWKTPLRNPFSFHLVANMAFAEIPNCLCVLILLIWQYEGGHKDSIVHNIWCVASPLVVLSRMVVPYSLAALAFYRYRVLINPVERPRTSRKLKILIFCCLWLVPAAVCVPIFIRNRFVGGHCELHPVGNVSAYALVLFTLIYVLPYLVMLASYGAVAWNLRQPIGQKPAAHTSIIPSSAAATELLTLTNDREEERTLQEGKQRRQVLVDVKKRRGINPDDVDAEQDLLKMIYAIILIFVICFLPYNAMFLWERLADVNEWKFRYHSLMRMYIFLLTCLPSALHPWCYGAMNSFYAKAFTKVFFCS